jgi:hypothetical protein
MVKWSKTAIQGGQYLIDDAEDRICPPIESLRRRWEASDKSWLAEWVDQDGDDAACDDR